jgi:hypothetical protein
MQAYILDLEDRPGSWADVAEKIAQKGVNTLGFALTNDGHGYVGLVGSDEMSTREVLDEIHCKYREVELLPVTLQNVPGTTAKLARTLANAGINIEFFAPTGESGDQTVFVLGVDRIEEARRVLGTQVTGSFGNLWPKAVAGVTSR